MHTFATTTTHKTLRGPRGGMIMANNVPELNKKLQSAIFPGIQGGPLMHVIAAKAIAFKEAMDPSFIDYQKQVLKNAKAMEKVLKERDVSIISGGTHNHLLLLDITNTGFSGKEAEAALGRANITVNKNSIPNDPRSPFVTSGLRIGSPAITTRGFKESECELVANLLCDVIFNCGNEDIEKDVAQKIVTLCDEFPVYG